MKNNSYLKSYFEDTIDTKSNFYKFFLNNLLPPLIIIWVNTILTQLILRLASFEKCVRFSEYQESILNRAFIYFSINMLVIPGLAIPASSNIIQIVMEVQNVSNNIFSLADRDFFIILIVQSSAITFLNNLNNFGKLYNGLFSPTYSVEYINYHKDFIKFDTWIFTYGFNYAQILTFLAICIIYSIINPLCVIASIIYLISRIITDIHNLLIFYKKEIESSGSLIHNAMNKTIIIIIITQICVLLNIYQKGRIFSIFYMFVLISYTIIFYLIFSKPFIKSDHFPDETESLSKKELDVWTNKFTHPYIREKENYDQKLPKFSNRRKNRQSIRIIIN